MSEEYGYHGEKVNTISKKDCTKMMEDIVYGVDTESRPLTEEEINIMLRKIHGHDKDSKILFAEHLKEPLKELVIVEDDITIKSQKFKNIITVDDQEYESVLTDKDKTVLVDYAYKLFSTTLNPEALREDMYGLVQMIWLHRAN